MSAITLLSVLLAAPLQGEEGHSGGVHCVAVSPSGTRIVSGGASGRVVVWDVESRRRVASWKAHRGAVYSVAFHPDGRKVLTGGTDGSVALWDVAARRLIYRLSGHESEVYSVAISPDGTRAAHASQDGAVRTWSLDQGVRLKLIEGHQAWVHSVAFSWDGRVLVSGGRDHAVKFWKSDTGASLTRHNLNGHRSSVLALAANPTHASTVVSVGADNQIKVWNLERPGAAIDAGALDFPAHSVAYHPQGQTVLLGTEDHQVVLWDLVTRRRVTALAGHLGLVSGVAFLPDGKTAVSGSWDNTVRLWDVGTGALLHTFGEARDLRPPPTREATRPSPRESRSRSDGSSGFACIIPLIVGATITTVFILIVVWSRNRGALGNVDAILSRFDLSRRGAVVERARTLERVRVTKDDWQGEVIFRIRETRYQARLPRSLPVVSVSRKRQGRGSRLPGTERVSIGLPEFETQFNVFSNSAAYAREFLGDEICHCLEELSRLAGGPLRLDLRGDRLDLWVGKMMRDEKAIDWFFSLSEKIIDVAAGGESGRGFEVVKTEESAGGECQICSTQMDAEKVYCRKCGTPHHEDCWTYNGICSTFGCGEPRFVRGPAKS